MGGRKDGRNAERKSERERVKKRCFAIVLPLLSRLFFFRLPTHVVHPNLSGPGTSSRSKHMQMCKCANMPKNHRRMALCTSVSHPKITAHSSPARLQLPTRQSQSLLPRLTSRFLFFLFFHRGLWRRVRLHEQPQKHFLRRMSAIAYVSEESKLHMKTKAQAVRAKYIYEYMQQ